MKKFEPDTRRYGRIFARAKTGLSAPIPQKTPPAFFCGISAAIPCAALCLFLSLPPAAFAQNALELSLQDAVLSALENNPSLQAQRYQAASAPLAEDEEFSAFLPELSAEAAASRILQNPGSGTDISAQAGITETLPTGTSLRLSAAANRTEITPNPARPSDPYSLNLDLRLTQSLLKGGPAGITANLAGIRSARLGAFASLYELKGYTETMVYEVEAAYWDYYLAVKNLEIYRESLRLAEENLANTRQRIIVGSLPEIELAAAQAEVASRRNDFIGAEGNAETTRLKLIHFVSPKKENAWDSPVNLLDTPSQPDFNLDTVKSHVELGMKSRPDLAQARIAVEKGELEVARTKNGLLPKLDVFINLGATGYADSFGTASRNVFDKDSRITGGLTLTYPLGNYKAGAGAQRAVYSRMQQEEALRNMELLTEQNIRTAYVTVQRSRAQIAASEETARLRKENFNAEAQKYNVGRSTSYDVARAGRDLLEAQLAEVRSIVDYLKSILTLYREEGTLLERRGIQTVR